MICFISGLEASGTVTISPYFEGWSLNLGDAMGLSLLLSFTLHFLYLEMPCSTLWSFPSLCRATILYFIKPLMNQSFFFFFFIHRLPIMHVLRDLWETQIDSGDDSLSFYFLSMLEKILVAWYRATLCVRILHIFWSLVYY